MNQTIFLPSDDETRQLMEHAWQEFQQQAEEQRMWKQMHKPFAQMLAEEAQQRVQGKTKDGHDVLVPVSCVAHQMPESVEHQTVNDCMKDADRPQRIKTHEEVLRERAAMESYRRMSDAEKTAAGGNALAMGLIGMILIKRIVTERTDV